MVQHYIVLSSSYSLGKRIALHLTSAKPDSIKKVLNRIQKECGKEVSISTHSIITDSDSWESVYEKDAFFADVMVITSIGEFIQLIKEDQTLKRIDIAKYIASKCQCTFQQLQDLVNLCSIVYSKQYDEPLFENSEESIETLKEGNTTKLKSVLYMPARSRLLFATNGSQKVQSIDKTLDKYGDYTELLIKKR